MRWLVLLCFCWGLMATAWADDLCVTGRPASVDFQREVLLRHHLPVPPDLRPLGPGHSRQWGGVRLVNRPMPSLAPSVLTFSDHPEKVADSGVLFWGGGLSWRPVRLQYYHEGAAGPSHVVSLYLDNPGTEPIKVHVVAGVGGPGDPLVAGHASARDFLRHLDADEGEIVTLAPGEIRELFAHLLQPDQTVSGLVQMTLITPGLFHYHVVSRNSVDDPVSFPTIESSTDVHGRGAFMVGEVTVDRSYRVGGEPLTISIGNHAPQNVLAGRALMGDYGVTYRVRVRLINPTSQPATVALGFEPRGGAAAGTLIIDGQTVEVGVTQARTRVQVRRFRLSPDSTAEVRLLTMPEGASSYPVRLVWQSVGAVGAARGARWKRFEF